MRFTRYTVSVLALLLATGLAGQAQAAGNEATATADVSATVVEPIDLTKDQDMSFGSFTVGDTAGTIILGTDGSTSSTGGASTVTNGNQAAAFTATGEDGRAYDVTLPTSATLSGPGDDMTADTFTDNATGTLTGGTETFQVGATLNVNADQEPGSYSGSFDVTVAYQ